METGLKPGTRPETEINHQAYRANQGPATTLVAATAAVSEELCKLLGPLVSPLLRDAGGALDLKKTPGKNSAEFRNFLIAQVKVDGIAFNEYLFASYHRILAKEEYQPLLEGLFQEAQRSSPLTPAPHPLGEGKTTNLLQRFTAEIVAVSSQKFVTTHIQNTQGRQRILSILSDVKAYTKELRADLAKAVAQSGYEMGSSSASFQEFNRQIAVMNYANLGVNETEMTRATTLAQEILQQVEESQTEAERLQTRYDSNPGAVQRFAGLERELGRKIRDEEIQEKAKLAKHGASDPNPATQLRGKLARFWLVVVDEAAWKQSNAYKRAVNGAFLLKETERLLKAGENIHSQEAFLQWNKSVRDFLQGGLHVTGTGLRREVGDFLSSDTVVAMLAPLPQAHRAPFDDLKQFVDEIHCAGEMGEKMDVASAFKPGTPHLKVGTTEESIQEIKVQFLTGLQQAKRSLWHGYKQHRALSRGISNVASWFGKGDIEEIKAGQRALDQLIEKVKGAKDAAQIHAAVDELQHRLKQEGLLQLALRASEMEGCEQIIGLGQSITILLVGRGLLQLPGKFFQAASPIAQAAVSDSLALRTGKAFGLGLYLSAAENAVAAASAELRPDGEHLSRWFKDSASTAVAMMLTAPLASYLGHPATSPSILHRVALSYGTGGAKILGRIGADVALEYGEEWFDAFFRARMDDSFAVIGKDQAREIAMVTSFGGGFAQMRVIGEILKSRTSPPTILPDETPLVPPAQIIRMNTELLAQQTPTPPTAEPIADEFIQDEMEPHPSDRPTAIYDSKTFSQVSARLTQASLPEIEDEAIEAEDSVPPPPPPPATPNPTEIKAEPESPEEPPPMLELPPEPPADSVAPSDSDPEYLSGPYSEPIPAMPAPPVIDMPYADFSEQIREYELRIAQLEGEKYAAQWLANEAKMEARQQVEQAQQQLQLQGAASEGQRLGLQWKIRWETAALQEKITEGRRRVAELERDLNQLKRDKRLLGQDNTELESQVEHQGVRIAQLQDEKSQLAAQRDEQGTRAAHAEARIGELVSLIEQLTQDLKGEREKLAQAEKRYGALTLQLEREKQRVEGLGGEIESLKNIIRQAAEQAKRKDERIKELSENIEALKQDSREVEETKKFERARLEQQIQTLEREKSGLSTDAKRSEERLTEAQARLSLAGQRIDSLNQRLDIERSALLTKAQQYRELQGRFTTLDHEVRSLRKVDDLRVAAEDRLIGQLEENQRLHGILQTIRRQSKETIGRLRHELRETQGKMKGLEEQIRHSERAAKKSEKKLAEIEAALAQSEQALKDLQSTHKNQAIQLDSAARHKKYLEDRVQALTTGHTKEREKLTILQTEATQLRQERGRALAANTTLERDLTRTKDDLAKTKGALDELRGQDVSQRRELSYLRQEVDRNKTAQGEAARGKNILSEQLRLNEEQAGKLGTQQVQIAALEQALRDREATFNKDLREANEQMERVVEERNSAKEEVERLRRIEESQAARIRALTQEQKRLSQPPPPEKRESQPPQTVRIPESYASGLSEVRRNMTPTFTPSIADRENDLKVARADLERTRGELAAAHQRLQTAEDNLAQKEHDLNTQISYLTKVLASRGPAYFGNKDPRRVKVDASAMARLALTDKKGETIGRAEIIAGGQEGFVLPMKTRNGSIISAKTTKGVPKKHQGGNEDAVYFSHFTVSLGKESVEVTVLGGTDGAGGEKRGDLATVFLQGVHALVSEAAFEGRIPDAKELFEAGRRTVDAQHDFHGIPRNAKSQVTGAGAVVVLIGNKAMIATGGDAPVVFSRKMPDGFYRSEGYSNLDVIPTLNAITNGIHLRSVTETDDDADDGKSDQVQFQDAPPPRLYFVKDIGPEDHFTIGSDGFFNHLDMIFTDGAQFTGSKEWQVTKSQRGYLLQDNFRLLDLMLTASTERDDIADHLHDMVLANMKSPGQQFSFRKQNVFFPARKNDDNIFVISFKQGQAQRNGFQIPPEYQVLERIYEAPPPPLLKYQVAGKEDTIEMIRKYMEPLNALYGPKIGQAMAQAMANLYRNFPSLDEKFSPTLLVQAGSAKARGYLFGQLEAFIENHPEMKIGDNQPFMDAARRDVKKIQEASRALLEVTRSEPPPQNPTDSPHEGKFQSTPLTTSSEPPPQSNGPRSSFSPGIPEAPASQPFQQAEFNFEKGPQRYGMGRLHLPDELLSELHLEFMHNGKTWLVRDLGSDHGSWVDGQGIHEPKSERQPSREAGGFHVVNAGSEIQIGNTHLKASIDRYGNLFLNKITARDSSFPHHGPATKPTLENNILRMNTAQTLEIGKSSQKLGIHKVQGKSAGLYLVVVEQAGLFGRIMDSHKAYVTIIRQQDHFWIQNNDVGHLVIRSEQRETRLDKKEQAPLHPGDWIEFGNQRLQFQPY